MSYEGQLRGDGLRVAIACARFNDLITEQLLAGAGDGLLRHGVDEASITVAWVPGAFVVSALIWKPLYQRPELLTRRRARSLEAPDAVDRRCGRSAEGR